MAIRFVPSPAQVLMCDFESGGFVRPEMQKVRHCVVISPRYRREWGTCLVVPLSTQPPDKVLAHHFMIAPNKYRFFMADTEIWAKANMLTHAGFSRLDRVKEDALYCNRFLDSADFRGVMAAVLHAVGCPQFAPSFAPDSP